MSGRSLDPDVNGLIDAARACFADAMGFYESLVRTNSHSRNVQGVEANARLIEAAFSQLGFSPRRVPSGVEGRAAHLVLDRAGTSGPLVVLSSHMDTVFPAEEEERNGFTWRIDGSRAIGPGTNDCKGGTVMMYVVLDTLRKAKRELFQAVSWRAIFDAAEEIDLREFASVARRECQNASACLVFEAGRDRPGERRFVTARKGRASFRIAVEGRAAHPGVDHERGANAIVEAARIAQTLAAMTDYDRALTVNPGMIRGGSAVNRVPDRCELEVEARAFDPEALESCAARIRALSGTGFTRSADGTFRCRVAVEELEASEAWPENGLSERLFEAFASIGPRFGVSVGREARGGLSDGNALALSLPVLDGCGPNGDFDHSSEASLDGSKRQEYAELSDFAERAAFVSEGIAAFLSKHMG